MEYPVQANANSVSDGMGKEAGTYHRGNLITITCSPQDKWDLRSNPTLFCNANGNNEQYKFELNGQTFTTGTLVGTIDGGNSFFPVGTLCQLTITTNNTKLYLYCWDENNHNNSGEITAYIQVH